MRVLLKLILDCEPDAAWRAIRSPAVFREVSAPLMTFESLEAGGFPESWPEGDHPVRAKALGLVPAGDQLIAISFPPGPAGVRMARDSGGGLSGSLAVVQEWEHTMAVSAAPGGGTLYRDRLEFGAGVLTPLLWPMYWAFWQIRAWRISRLATGW